MQEIFLEEVTIKNFRTHKDTVIPFHKGVNGLIGSSSSGKSNVIRAILWNILNEPSGAEFIMRKEGINEAAVLTKWSNGYTIERRKNRTGSKNFYALYKDGELVNEYTGFGTKVPPEIMEAHGMKPLSNGAFFNYADQLESAFMISGTPKSRAETIGNLEELGRIDEELSTINEDIRYDRKRHKAINEEITSKENEIKELQESLAHRKNKIDTLRMLSESVEDHQKTLQKVSLSIERIEELRKDLVAHEQAVSRATRVLESWDESLEEKIRVVRSVGRSIERLTEIRAELSDIKYMGDDEINRLTELSSIVDSAVSTFQKLNRLRKRLESIEEEKGAAQNYSERVAALDFSNLDKEVEKYKLLLSNVKRGQNIEAEVEKHNSIIEQSAAKIDQLLTEFVDALQDEKLCPTCSQSTDELSKNDIEKVI